MKGAFQSNFSCLLSESISFSFPREKLCEVCVFEVEGEREVERRAEGLEDLCGDEMKGGGEGW